MLLSQLVSGLAQKLVRATSDLEIAGITADSREVKPGWLFVACKGGSADGHAFIPQAIAAGAAAVVGEMELPPLPAAYVRVPDSPKALGLLAAAWHGYPSRKLVVIGVTGTDGKTTTVALIHRILLAAGWKAGMISTVSAVIGGQELDTGFHVTTPDAPAVQGYLARMVESGLTHCVLEVTSHGLAQRRTAGCEFDFGVMTNVTHEHLDYHGTFEAYRDSKALLFSGLGERPPKPQAPDRKAVLNAEDPSCEYLRAKSGAPVITYGVRVPADVMGSDIHLRVDGLQLRIHAGGVAFDVQSRLLGEYNASNILAAAALTLGGLGAGPEAVAAGVAGLEGISGRMERVSLGQAFTAIVDFAHTPNALRKALATARALAGGRVIAVFGSAGLRDREKRRRMAELAAGLADASILTAEDPRTESLDAILAEMAAGAEAGGGLEGVNFWRIPDRGEAIRFAVRMAQPGDVVIACGKGHEQTMCFGTTEHPWDDRLALHAAIAGRLGISGPFMPKLPTSV